MKIVTTTMKQYSFASYIEVARLYKVNKLLLHDRSMGKAQDG